MRKIYLILSAIVPALPCCAQQMAVMPNAELYISPHTDLYISGLTLKPSAGLTMSDRTIQKDTVVAHTFNNTYVNRTYQFSDTILFNGTIRIDYLEGELDGLTESSLQVSAYNGSSWLAAGTSTASATENYVSASLSAALPLGELMLTSATALPLEWGGISAVRQREYVMVTWYTMEARNITHFDLERSKDGLSWTTAVAGIAARNGPGRADYEQKDKPGHYDRVYYRIKQTDADGRFSFSKTVAVEKGNSPVVLSPNPAGDRFRISGISAADLQSLELLNSTGYLVRSWKGGTLYFDLSGLSAGIYYLKIRTMAGAVMHLPLSIR